MSRDSQRERNWKHLYLRSEKLSRSRQLGFEYKYMDPELVKELQSSVGAILGLA